MTWTIVIIVGWLAIGYISARFAIMWDDASNDAAWCLFLGGPLSAAFVFCAWVFWEMDHRDKSKVSFTHKFFHVKEKK